MDGGTSKRERENRKTRTQRLQQEDRGKQKPMGSKRKELGNNVRGRSRRGEAGVVGALGEGEGGREGGRGGRGSGGEGQGGGERGREGGGRERAGKGRDTSPRPGTPQTNLERGLWKKKDTA